MTLLLLSPLDHFIDHVLVLPDPASGFVQFTLK